MDIFDRIEKNLDRAAKLHAQIAARESRFDVRMKAVETRTAKSDKRFEAEMKAIKAKSDKRIKASKARTKAIEADIAESNKRLKASEARTKAIEADIAESNKRLKASEDRMKIIEAEAAEDDKRFEKKMKAHRKEMAELDAKIKKHQEAITRYKEEEAQYRKQQRKQEAVRRQEWEALKKMVGGIGETQGQVAEDFFYQALLKTRCIGDIAFEDVRPNVRVNRGGRQAEYDLIMDNGKFVAIVEVKQRLRKTDVEKVHSVLMPNAGRMLREVRGKTLVPVVAGMTTDKDAVALAHDYGYVVLTPNGQQVRTDAAHLRCIPCDP